MISELSMPLILHDPFTHVVSNEALSPAEANGLLTWLETNAPWRLVEESFYEQYEFNLLDQTLPGGLANVKSDDTLRALRAFVENCFKTRLTGRVDVTVHKLVSGQRIRIHNDFLPGQETHRLLIQLNRGWSDENGGLLMFFGSDNAADLRRIYRPNHNSSVAFEITTSSHHAVSTIHSGERFTLVYSFFGAK